MEPNANSESDIEHMEIDEGPGIKKRHKPQSGRRSISAVEFSHEGKVWWSRYVENTGILVVLEVFMVINLAPVLFGSPHLGLLVALFGAMFSFSGVLRLVAVCRRGGSGGGGDVEVATNPLNASIKEEEETEATEAPTTAEKLSKPPEKLVGGADRRFVQSFQTPTRYPGGASPCMGVFGFVVAVASTVAGGCGFVSLVLWVTDVLVNRYSFQSPFERFGYISVSSATGLGIFACLLETVLWFVVALKGRTGLKSTVTSLRRAASDVVLEELQVSGRNKHVMPLESVPPHFDVPWHVQGGCCCCCCGCKCYERARYRPQRAAHLRTHSDVMQLLLSVTLVMYLAAQLFSLLDVFLLRGLALVTVGIVMVYPFWVFLLLVTAFERRPECLYNPRACGGNCSLALTPLSRRAPAELEAEYSRDRLARFLAASMPLVDEQMPQTTPSSRRASVAALRSSAGLQSGVVLRAEGLVLPDTNMGLATVPEVGIDEEGDCHCRCRDGCYNDCFIATLVFMGLVGITSLVSLFVYECYIGFQPRRQFLLSVYTLPALGAMFTVLSYLTQCAVRRNARASTVRNWRIRAVRALLDGDATLGPPVTLEAAPSHSIPAKISAREVIFADGVLPEDDSAIGRIGGNPSDPDQHVGERPHPLDRFNRKHPAGGRWWRVFVIDKSKDPLYAKSFVRDNVPIV